MIDPSDERARFLKQLFDDAPTLVILTRGPDHVYQYLNRVALSNAGGARAGLIGRTIRESRPDLVGQGFLALYDGVYRTGESFVGQDARIDLVGPQGSRPPHVFRFSLTPWRGDDGKVSGVLTNAIDVTDEVAARELQQELVRQTEKLRAQAESERRQLLQLLDVIPVGMVIYDRGGRVTAGNKARARIVGDPSRSVDVASSAAYLRLRHHDDDRPYTIDELPITRALRGETIRGERLTIDRVDGVRLSVLVSAAPLRDAAGEIDSAVQFYQELEPAG